jgi:hypothetical protein
MAEIQQLFDLNTDPQAKQKILSGSVNVARCPSCGYSGMLSTPMVYHDPDKELLLTYFPPELGLPVNEQERLIGPMITQVTNKLAPEKRKAYLLRPQTMFTLQTMIDRILEADGITREMVEAQQKRMNLLQRLLTTTPEALPEVIKQEEALIDRAFFSLLGRIAQMAMGQGDQNTARKLAEVQNVLLEQTEEGRRLKAESDQAQGAMHDLQEASKTGLTREKLLDMMIAAPSEIYVTTMTGMVRSGLDYEFFQILTARIDAAAEGDKQKLLDLREKILALTKEIDAAMEEQKKETRALLEEILAAPDVEVAMAESLESVNDYFVELVRGEQEKVRKSGDLARSAKLGTILSVLEKASTPPPEVGLINELVSADDEAARQKLLEANAQMITTEFLQMFNGLLAQVEEQQPELLERVQTVYRQAVRFSMQQRMKQ